MRIKITVRHEKLNQDSEGNEREIMKIRKRKQQGMKKAKIRMRTLKKFKG